MARTPLTNRTCIIEGKIATLARPIEGLSNDPANLRLHDDRSIEAIMASLRRFGQQKPIVVDARGVVIAGNGTLEACKRLGWTHIAAAVSSLDNLNRTLYAIADNRTAELSRWDDDALRRVLGELDPDMIAAIGYSQGDLAELMDMSGQAGDVQQDAIPQPPAVATSQLGDLWLLGEHRLLCGDCTDHAAVKRVMDGQRAILFATDPPYLVGYDGTNHPQSFTNQANKDWSETYGKTWDDADENAELYVKFIGAGVAEALLPNAAWYCWHASRRQAMLEAVWNKHGAFVHCQIIWGKNRPVLTRTLYMWQHEPCLMGWIKGNMPPKTKAERMSTLWQLDTIPNGEDRPDHPTPKPIETSAIPIRQHTKPGDLCYEPFSGSGTQIVTCEQLGRRCYAIEIEPRYVDVAIMRWQALSGKSARLEDGRTFDELRKSPRPPAHAPQSFRIDPSCPPAQSTPAATRAVRRSPAGRTAPPTQTSTSALPGKAPKARRPLAGTEASGSDSGSSSSTETPSAKSATARHRSRSTTSAPKPGAVPTTK